MGDPVGAERELCRFPVKYMTAPRALYMGIAGEAGDNDRLALWTPATYDR